MFRSNKSKLAFWSSRSDRSSSEFGDVDSTTSETQRQISETRKNAPLIEIRQMTSSPIHSTLPLAFQNQPTRTNLPWRDFLQSKSGPDQVIFSSLTPEMALIQKWKIRKRLTYFVILLHGLVHCSEC